MFKFCNSSKILFIKVLSRVFTKYIFVFLNTRFIQLNLNNILIQFFFDKITNSLFFHKKENSSINLKKNCTLTKKYIVTLFKNMTFEKFTKKFVTNLQKSRLSKLFRFFEMLSHLYLALTIF